VCRQFQFPSLRKVEKNNSEEEEEEEENNCCFSHHQVSRQKFLVFFQKFFHVLANSR
jgi:hypothetical protein